MEKRIQIRNDYLYLPIQVKKQEGICAGKASDESKKQENQLLEIFCRNSFGEEKVFAFQIPLGEPEKGLYPADYYARLPVKQFAGKTLILRGDLPEEFFCSIHLDGADVRTDRGCSQEGRAVVSDGGGKKNETGLSGDDSRRDLRRPLIHFTAETGWINDPNGLVYQNGIYHLYFQYNPFDIQWENMSWGHAVSRDLLHWEQRDTVLFPDENGTMYSGSGIINERGMLGLPREALLFFYTAAGGTNAWSGERTFSQRIAYSLDDGNTLTKTERGVLDTVCGENRDPKVFWHEESQAYIMVLWLEESDFGIFRSMNLEDWEMSDRLTLEGAWECPDLICLKDAGGDVHWLFWSADGYYFWGSFDGYHFVTDGVRHEAYMNKMLYAAQTYAGVKGRVISIPWLRLPNRGRLYTGAMGIPREFSVTERDGKKLLAQRPVREYENSRERIDIEALSGERAEHITTAEGAADASAAGQGAGERNVTYTGEKGAAVELQVRCKPGVEEYRWWINGTEVSYVPSAGVFTVGDESCSIRKNVQDVSFLVDDVILEVTVDDGIATGVFELPDSNLEIVLEREDYEKTELYKIG